MVIRSVYRYDKETHEELQKVYTVIMFHLLSRFLFEIDFSSCFSRNLFRMLSVYRKWTNPTLPFLHTGTDTGTYCINPIHIITKNSGSLNSILENDQAQVIMSNNIRLNKDKSYFKVLQNRPISIGKKIKKETPQWIQLFSNEPDPFITTPLLVFNKPLSFRPYPQGHL